MSGTRTRSPLSVGVHRIADVAAGERVATAVAVVVAAWLVAYARAGFPEWMATALEVAAASVTLVMVFVIQHSQRRQQTASQMKLDELVRTSDADDAVAAIERSQHSLDDEDLEHAASASRG